MPKGKQTTAASTVLLRNALKMSVAEIDSTVEILKEVRAFKAGPTAAKAAAKTAASASSTPTSASAPTAVEGKGKGKGKKAETAGATSTEPVDDPTTWPPTAEAPYGYTKKGEPRLRKPSGWNDADTFVAPPSTAAAGVAEVAGEVSQDAAAGVATEASANGGDVDGGAEAESMIKRGDFALPPGSQMTEEEWAAAQAEEAAQQQTQTQAAG